MTAEAEIGERIMRALIIRRVESGSGGPVIVGHAGDPDVLRLQNFLTRNGHPHVRFDPDHDEGALALIERFHLPLEALPIVLCPGGQLLRKPDEAGLGRCIGLVGPIDPERVYDLLVVGAGPSGLATAVYAGSEGLSVIVLDSRAFAVGDVRSGSVKRVAASVGDGAQVVASLHGFLQRRREAAAVHPVGVK